MYLIPRVAYAGAPLESQMPEVLQIPVLRVVYEDLSSLKELSGVLAFTSKRGVVSLKMSNVSIRSDSVYCIGSKTSESLASLYSLSCKVPQVQNTDGLADLLIGSEKSISLISSDQVSIRFLERLRESGMDVHRIIAYRLEENDEVDFSRMRDVKRILFGSSRAFEIVRKNAESFLAGIELYAIGQPTEDTMKKFGYVPVESFYSPDIRAILHRLLTKR